ncbi:MAG: VCBS repeat-containing protein, partial [Planctomycetes bacterium]|nr:VCBS repeat-containing protein [Planctomycetota bacterium]
RVDEWPDAGDIGHGDTKDHLHGSFSPLGATSCVVADLDGDGRLEIMVHPNYHSTLMAFHFHDGLTKPTMMWKTPKRFKYDLYCHPILAADVDGDGRLEIVFHDNDLIRLIDGRTGEEKSSADMGCPQGLFGPMACADVDGDGRAEVVLVPQFKGTYKRNTVTLAGWDGKAFVRRWSRDFEAEVSTRGFAEPLTSPFADVDGDKKLEVIVQVGPDVLALNGADGAEKHRVAQASLSQAADLDGDGVAEIIVKKDGKTVVFNGKGGFGPKSIAYPANWGWKDWGDGDLCQLRSAANGQTEVVNPQGKVKAVLPGAAHVTSPIVADLEGDGKMEVLVRDAQGVIRVLDATGGSPQPKSFPELKCDGPGDLSRGSGLTVCDLDGEGKAELLLRQGGHLVVANSDGTIRFKSEQGGLKFPSVGEFNGDGVKDIACYAGSRWIAFSGKDGKALWDAAAPESNEVATWDVDGDGRDELTGKHGPVFLLNGADGRTLWTAFRREQCALGLGVFADLDGDG